MERLKAESSSHQAMVAEKHKMERQLNSLEIQLDNEKHAHERTQAKGSQQTAEITKLSARVDELRNELAGESRAKQQQELDKRRQSSEFDSQRALLEGKIDSLKQQLRSTKDKLQEAQNELLQRRNGKVDRGDDSEPRSRTIPLQRPGPSGHVGVTIATPGAVRVQEKMKRDSALPGDKSAFSITPFLNRTGAPADSPLSSVADEDDMREDADTTHELLDKGNPIGQPKRIGSALRRQLSPTQDRNPISKPAKSRARDVSATKNDFKKPANRLDRQMLPVDTDDEQLSEHEQVKPKKRKLGGPRDRSLMEEEDDDDDDGEPRQNKKVGRKLALGAGRTSKLGGMQQPSTSNGERLQRGLGFGAPMGFSPLKRDRKRL
jgi:multidrug efflux pump subunit AcrA (membrane-fusion protein)